MEAISKVCTKCKETKALTEYYDYKGGKRKSSWCKSCLKEKRIAYADRLKEIHKAYYQANKEKINKQNNEYYYKNKEHLAKKAKEWYERNKDYVSEREKQYYINNREKIIERVRNYKKANPELVANSKARSAAKRREYRRAAERQRILDLPDWYVKKKLLGFKKDIDVPEQLIEVRRVLHQLKRRITNEKRNTTTK